jgi:general secretion pathway protein G
MQGFTLIELVMVVCIVAITATVGLDRLFWYQGQAEKINMEYTASMIKSGLWMSAASLMMADRGAEVPTLAQQNPINLLAEKPANYLGELDSSKTEAIKGGNWFYDASSKQVVYVVSQRRNFTPVVADDFMVRYSMKVLYSEMEITKGKQVKYVAGVTLVPLSKYVWQ